MGKHGPEAYLRKPYVEPVDKKEIIEDNTDPLVQKFSGYNQWNILQKVKWKPKEHIDFNYQFSYA